MGGGWAAPGHRRAQGDALRQLVGFDINEGALRYAALGLYLLSIELDPNPRPVDKLAFDDLRGTVLHQVKGPEEEEGESLGSLGPGVGDEHKGRYDLVVGNPPWASGTQLPGWTREGHDGADCDRTADSKHGAAVAERGAGSAVRVAGSGVGETGRADCVRTTCALAVRAGRRRCRSATRGNGSARSCGTSCGPGASGSDRGWMSTRSVHRHRRPGTPSLYAQAVPVPRGSSRTTTGRVCGGPPTRRRRRRFSSRTDRTDC